MDPTLQTIVEEELAKGIRTVRAKGGCALMIEPKTGKILSSHQSPSLEKNVLFQGKEYGSIIKPMNIAICMKANEHLIANNQEPILLPEEWIPFYNGATNNPNFLNLDAAIRVSSNAYPREYVQQTINKMGAIWYRTQLINVFGFSKKVGLNDQAGFIPSPGKFYNNDLPEWSKSTPRALAIGYSSLISALQMVRAHAVIANGGYPCNENLKGEQLLSTSSCNRIIQAMKFVVKEGGNSVLADVLGYSIAGKSGTARKFINGQYSSKHHISSFVGFPALTATPFVLLVSIDEPVITMTKYGSTAYGGVAAGPIFREITKRALKHLDITPNNLPDSPGYKSMMQQVRELDSNYQKHNSPKKKP